MMADIGTPVPVRTRTIDEIANEIAKMIRDGGQEEDTALLYKIVEKVLNQLGGGLFVLTRGQLETYMKWDLTQ